MIFFPCSSPSCSGLAGLVAARPVLLAGCVAWLSLLLSGPVPGRQTAPSASSPSTAASQSTAQEIPEASGAGADRVGFAGVLGDLAVECQNNGWTAELEITLRLRSILLERDPRRQYLFLPGPEWLPGLPAGVRVQPQWLESLQAARRAHAESLFRQVLELKSGDPGADAWQRLHEVLFWDPDHGEARRVLGHRGEPGNWQVISEKIRSRKPGSVHALMNWKKGDWIQVQTDHFIVSSIADEASTIRLAEQAERWRWVWQQVFFDFWNSSGVLTRTLAGKTGAKVNRRKFEIVLFPDRESYIRQLEQRVPGVKDSTGYYSDVQQVSFFYVSDDPSIQDTWRHELTHQMFQESVSARPGVFDEGWLWLGEGVAMYMESLQDFGSHVTLGGFDAARLQFSRIRRLREGYAVPTRELVDLPLARFQVRPDVRNLYSQSSGVTQMLMTAEGGRYRDGLVAFLRLLYAGKLREGSFDKLVGIDADAVDGAYENFLAVAPEEVVRFLLVPEQVNWLALPRCGEADPLELAGLRSIGRCSNLKWLDLSGQPLSADGVRALAGCSRLQQLFLRRSELEPEAIALMASWPALQELDLSGCQLQDPVLDDLIALPSLRQLDLRENRFSPAGIERLRKSRPDLEVVQ